MFPLTIKTIVWCAFLCAINASLLAYAADFNAVDTNTQELLRQMERQRLLREQQETIPDARGMGERLQQIEPMTPLSIPTDDSPCFTIHTVTLVGDNADLFVTTLQKTLSDHTVLGRCLGVVGINAVMAMLQNAIIAKGYTTTRVLAAPQDLTTGILVFNIIPGRISQIQLAPNSSRWLALWNATAMRNGDLLNLRDIEQSLENLKRPPTVEADIQIAPALAESGSPLVGYSDILIRYQQRFPFRLSVNIDDAGFKSTGRYQGGITLSGDNLLGLNDLVYINRTHDLGGGDAGKRGNQGFNAHYSVPFGYWMLSANTSNNFFFQEVAGISQSYIFSGKAQNSELQISRLLYRNSVNKSALSVKGFLRKTNNFIDDIEIEVQRRRTAGWEMTLNQSWFIGDAVLDYNLGYRRGTGAKNALKAPEEPFNEGTHRMKLWLADINLSLPLSLQTPWGRQAMQYQSVIRGQVNRTPLTPQDRFNIGNRFTVRGFDGQLTLLADNGWFIRNDLSLALADSGQTFYWGLDYGEVGGPSADNLLGKYLAGTVIGFRGVSASRFGQISYDVFVGKPLNKPTGFQTQDTTAGFNINYAI